MSHQFRSKVAALCAVPFAIGLAACLPVHAAGQGRPLEIEDYYRFKGAGSPVISPDGSRVAYVVTSLIEEENRRHSEIWLASSDGDGEAVRLTSPSFSASSPTWSPDGALLAFSSPRPGPDGSRSAGPWFLRMDAPSGEAFQIEGLTGSPVFSPGGDWIAYTAPRRAPAPSEQKFDSEFERKTTERFDGRVYDWMNARFDRRGYLPDPRDPAASPAAELHIVPAEGGPARPLTDMEIDVGGPAWSPDGARIAFTADEHQRDEHTYERADLWIVDQTGEIGRVTDDEFNYSSPSWSPDGRAVVVRGNVGLDVVIREEWDHGAPSDLFVFRPDRGSAAVNLTAEWDYIPGAPTWGPDGFVYFSAAIGGDAGLFRVSGEGGPVERLTRGDRRASAFTFSADFSRIAFRATDPTLPGDIWTADLSSGMETRITEINAALLAELDLSSPDRLSFESPDGTRIEGWMLPARGYRPGGGPYPMVLETHGGPHGAYGHSWSFQHQLLAANGYMVLYTNPRASTGYGEEFRWGTWGGWGFSDYEDVMAGVDHAIASYDIDEARMGVTGYSYGGYLTNWIITQTDRFAAAVAGASISNWVSDYGVADIPRTKESEFYGPPWEERGLENLLRSSPIIHAKGVTTPTMFVHGEADLRVPIEEAEQMYVALRKQRVPAKFVRYPESYHGGWTPWRMVHRYWIQLEWWEQWLAERATSQ
jgi:dipeptidyl aminopeptidase/acylaminoacyl peptidase